MCFPVIFLLAGSFMGADELNTYLAPVLAEKSKGYVSWGLLPSYPTLRAYVELLFDTPEFFVMFWNSVKSWWTTYSRYSSSLGICKI